jgi:hypothetical protein
MSRRRVAAALLLLGACKAELSDNAGADANNSQADGGSVFLDATDAQVALGAWGTAMPVPGASDSTLVEDDCTLSSNKLELYFKRSDAGDNNLYMMTRASVTAAWGAPLPLGILNSSVAEESPRLSSDDKTMYFGRNGQIYKSTRTSVGESWNAPTEVTALNTSAYEKWADVCDDGYAIVSRMTTNNDQDLFEGTVTGGATTAIAAFNTANTEQGTFLSADCLHVYFQSNRDNNQFDLFEASRMTATALWSNPTKMLDFNTTTSSEEDPWVSTDQRMFVFASNVNGTKDIFMATR